MARARSLPKPEPIRRDHQRCAQRDPGSSSWRQFLNTEGRFQVEKALDAHCFAQVVAASPPPFGTSGSDLIAKSGTVWQAW